MPRIRALARVGMCTTGRLTAAFFVGRAFAFDCRGESDTAGEEDRIPRVSLLRDKLSSKALFAAIFALRSSSLHISFQKEIFYQRPRTIVTSQFHILIHRILHVRVHLALIGVPSSLEHLV